MSQSPENLLERAIALHEARRLDEAENLYSQVLSLQPDNIKAIHLLGLVASDTARHERALELMNRSLQIAPKVPQFHNNIGEVYRAMRQPEKAVEHYQIAIKLKP